ncbi:hypothetical protein J4464_04960 [Candidatus Woesearchaeota archaeon]|nr:hypothetical protein [Candidatus Woesearchaeota archaeon]
MTLHTNAQGAYLTDIEQMLMEMYQRTPALKDVEVIVHADSVGLLVYEKATERELIHAPGGIHRKDSIRLQRELSDLVEGVSRMRAEGYHVTYCGAQTAQQFEELESEVDLSVQLGIPLFLLDEVERRELLEAAGIK